MKLKIFLVGLVFLLMGCDSEVLELDFSKSANFDAKKFQPPVIHKSNQKDFELHSSLYDNRLNVHTSTCEILYDLALF
jgi:hypothetical protein